MFHGILKIGLFIDVSWRCLKAQVAYLRVTFTNFEISELHV